MRSEAATRTWTGAASNYWSNPANWNGGVPVTGDDLLFTPLANPLLRVKSINDLPSGLRIRSIRLSRYANYDLSGNAIVLSDGLDYRASRSANSSVMFSRITLSKSQTWSGLCYPNAPWSMPCAPPTDAKLDLGSIDLNGNTLTLSRAGGLSMSIMSLSGGGAVVGGQSIGPSSTTTALSGCCLELKDSTFGDLSQTFGISRIEQSTVGDILIDDGGGIAASHVTCKNLEVVEGKSLSALVGGGVPMLDVHGRVALGNAVLDLSEAAGDSPILINNDGTDPVIGTFKGLPEGALLNRFGRTFRITYAGGDGNDVQLIASSTPAADSETTLKPSMTTYAAIGDAVKFTAHTDGAACDQFRFYDGTTLLGPIVCEGNDATVTSSISRGEHDVVAAFLGGGGLASSSAATRVYGGLTTILFFYSQPATGHPGEPVTLTARVSVPDAAPYGTMSFVDDDAATTLCTATVDQNGVANCTTTFATLGWHRVIATYDDGLRMPSSGVYYFIADPLPASAPAEPAPALSDTLLVLLAIVIAAAGVILHSQRIA